MTKSCRNPIKKLLEECPIGNTGEIRSRNFGVIAKTKLWGQKIILQDFLSPGKIPGGNYQISQDVLTYIDSQFSS